jgi:hypothetical protein
METREINGKIVTRSQIIATDLVVFEVWEPSCGLNYHSTVTTIDGERYGKLTTRTLPEDLNALPSFSDERYEAVRSWHRDLDAKAQWHIMAAYPRLAAYNLIEFKSGQGQASASAIEDLSARLESWNKQQDKIDAAVQTYQNLVNNSTPEDEAARIVDEAFGWSEPSPMEY